MKIVVFAHRLDIGGTQVNAIELSAALRDLHGHDVVFFATPGPMVELVAQKRLRFLPAPEARAHPSPARMHAFHEVVRRERPDLIHVWDWPQCLDAFYAVHVVRRIPMVVTCMSMTLPRMLPKSVPTTFGTPELVEQARSSGRLRLHLILPPVDVRLNAPGAVDAARFRKYCGINDHDLTLVTVSRLVDWMKAEGLRRVINVVRSLGRELPLRLIIVGDGASRKELEKVARETNGDLKRNAVVLTGALLDPREAYEAADVIVGMGGSALRGMAFGKPTVVIGERGFSAVFTPNTADMFYRQGIYGLGDGDHSSAALARDIGWLATNPDQRTELGAFARQFVLRHFSLVDVSAHLDQFCRDAVVDGSRFTLVAADALRTASIVVGRKLVRSGLRRMLKRNTHHLPIRSTVPGS